MAKSREQLHDGWLVLRCQSGDSKAFDELVQQWQQRLWWHAFHLTGQEDTAWELVQECWVAVVQGIHRLQDASAFPCWVHRILHLKYVDWVRSHKQQQRMTSSLPEVAVDDKPDSDHPLRDALFALPPDVRSLLVLRYIKEFEISAISRILDIPDSPARSPMLDGPAPHLQPIAQAA